MKKELIEKLKEIGFNPEPPILETILGALPKNHDFFTRGAGKYELRIWHHEGRAFIGYQNFNGFDKLLTFEQEENESLADTAARLLIKLVEEKIINLK